MWQNVFAINRVRLFPIFGTVWTRELILGGTLRDTFDEAASALRMLGTANATGALAAGAAFQGFAARPEIQQSIKIAALAYLFGILMFAMSYLLLLSASQEADFFLHALKERAEWEQSFWQLKKKPEIYLKLSRRFLLGALIFGGVTAACFFGGVLYTITLVIRI
jgi:hypothetical protein